MLTLTKTAMSVLAKRYLNKDAEGNSVETPEGMFRRVAEYIANGDTEQADIFYNMMAELRFLPNSPTLMNAGNPLGMLSACFVLPVEDNIESIFDTIKHAAIVNKSGGGTGFSFSRIRPANDPVLSTQGVASGPVSFMKVFDAATDIIKQGGKRRGANMGVLRVDHPDIREFITAKDDTSVLTNFNISVGLTEEFMNALSNNDSYPLRNPRDGSIVKHEKASDIFNLIAEHAYQTGEPGIIFLYNINRDNIMVNVPGYGEIEATNPCGEEPLYPYESCNLGSINLANHLTTGGVDMDALARTVADAVVFMDTVIDRNRYPLPEIKSASIRTRKIGLGVMGFADVLLELGIPYASRKAVNLAGAIMKHIKRTAEEASMVLAIEKGPCQAILDYHKQADDPFTPIVRNLEQTTIAPTGTLSIIGGCSSGIEPVFAFAYKRTILGGEEFFEVHPAFDKKISHLKPAQRRKVVEAVIKNDGRINKDILDMAGIEDDPAVWSTAHDIPPAWHVRIQAAFQQYVDAAVSKTINLPDTATVRDVKAVYMQAAEAGLKGVTVYRDGSREGQVLSCKAVAKPAIQKVAAERPDELAGATTQTKSGCGKILVTVNHSDNGPFETLFMMGKTGGCESAQIESIGRLISLGLRSGIPLENYVEQLSGIRCHKPCFVGGKAVHSCADAIAGELAKHCKGELKLNVSMKPIACPDCGATLEKKEGCDLCPSCGYSHCGGGK